jgi:hypothetical protein
MGRVCTLPPAGFEQVVFLQASQQRVEQELFGFALD